MKEIAIIGATACGKTALSLEIASKTNCVILSLMVPTVNKRAPLFKASDYALKITN